MLACALSAKADLSDQALAWHWQSETAERARQATLAASLWLEQGAVEPLQWQSRVEALRLGLVVATANMPAAQVHPADGLFAWLVQAREVPLQSDPIGPPEPELARASDLLGVGSQGGQLARLLHQAAIEAPSIWARVQQRLDELESLPADQGIAAFWQSLMQRMPEPAGVEDPASVTPSDSERMSSEPMSNEPMSSEPLLPEVEPAALEQAQRIRTLATLEDRDERRALRARLAQVEAERAWAVEDRLAAVWWLLETLMQLASQDGPASQAAELQALIMGFSSDTGRALRQIDTDLPVILALLEDAAASLAAEPPARTVAMSELADVYARLALFAGDASFYLDQPVREDLRLAVASCTVDPELVGPVPRETYERCLERLVALMSNELGREELVGDGDGPFSDVFLRREMSLVSWQRAAYLDGHLDWLLGAGCTAPAWESPLEWSILAQYLSRWVRLRPVFFDSPRWREAIDLFARQANLQREAAEIFLDCLTGFGSQRRDPVERLLGRHGRALSELDRAIRAESATFYAEVTREQADIDLDGDAAQQTAYRPDGLTIGPCPEASACGVRAELSVSRALLGRFPNAYLLADQLRLGQLDLCFDQVRWVDRQMRPARSDDRRVANYDGHLSFELVGTLERGGEISTVFRQRLRSAEPRHYLFAASDPEVLAMDCPETLAGQPIASRLPDGRVGLVPDRLTYFVSQPTTAEAELQANWDRGAEWRDWFVTGDRVETIEANDGTVLAAEVQAELANLASRRERQLASRLLRPMSAVDSDPLSMAMAAVAENSALLRRVLEIHYPRVLRHDNRVRALLAGEGGLLTRDRLRQLRDSATPLAEAARIGRERLDRLREHWLTLPVTLREVGQPAPEMDFAAERLAELRRLSRTWLERDESSPAP